MKLTADYGFEYSTSSLYFHQMNGTAERAVQTAKVILANKNPDIALLNYGSTVQYATGVSPAKALTGCWNDGI